MNLNPVVVIPSYWCGRRSSHSINRGVVYDHMTPIDQPGELSRCLESLRHVVGVDRIILLVAAEPGVENQAVERVRAIADHFMDLNIVIIGEAEMRHIHRRFEQVGIGEYKGAACLTGYGAIRNLGLIVASIFGHDTVVFVDDDEVIPNADFLERAMHGIACKTPTGSIITAKTGFFYDSYDSPKAPEDVPWYDHFWNKAADFNDYIEGVLRGPRLSRSNVCCGGCMVLHADAYGSIAFDPWIARGEDLDYLINARMYGSDVWFDNQFSLLHLPPEGTQHSGRFEQDVYRWFYEVRKIEFAKTQIDLMQVAPSALDPYPGPWLEPSIHRRARLTAYLRAIGHKEHGEYLRIGNKTIRDAGEFARENCANYFELQHQWPSIVRAMWSNSALATQLGTSGLQSSSASYTSRFSAITSE